MGVRCEYQSSIPGQVKPKTLNMIVMAPLPRIFISVILTIYMVVILVDICHKIEIELFYNVSRVVRALVRLYVCAVLRCKQSGEYSCETVRMRCFTM